jgi:hypothetical protein
MEKFPFKRIAFILFTILLPGSLFSWGFFAHKNINKLAVFTLPAPMAGFYKANIDYLIETAVLPDKRRYILKEEAPRHYIDLEFYLDSLTPALLLRWSDAIEKYTEDSLMKHGILPWHLILIKKRLTEAFEKKNAELILKLSAEIGHYLADAHVPLHTTKNYNGQYSNQHGIHGLWESRLPELFFDTYDFFVGPATYLNNCPEVFQKIIFDSHSCLDSVFSSEVKASMEFSEDVKYSIESRGAAMVKVYSREFCQYYHELLDGQIERRMRQSVKMVGNIWYTCWVDAGRPDLKELTGIRLEKNKEKSEEGHQECGH